MAIRMKEWGMMEYPGRAAQLSVHGIGDWGNSVGRMGQAVAGFLENTGHFVQEQLQVTATGNLADFAGKLKEIEQSTREELNMLPIRDWDYAWEQTSAPMLDSALNELPEEAREAGKELAMLYNRRASLEARRDYELRRIGKARSQWQERVQSAVEEGDEHDAAQWLESGRQIFVPENEMKSHHQSLRSQCAMKRWQRRLQEQPLETILTLQQEEIQDWPDDPQDATHLKKLVNKTKQSLSQQLAQELAERVSQGYAPSHDDLQQVVAAGLLSPLPQESPTLPLSTAAACDWIRRIDEREDDTQQEAALKMEIALAPIPLKERQMLLSRLHQSAEIPVEKRREYSRRLWNAYRAGVFGCCGDEAALRCLGELQEKVLYDMLSQNQASEHTLSRIEAADHWVCFEN